MTSTRILIVEDDPIARGNMRDMLERAGFDCLEAEDGRVGLAIARAEKPVLVLMDMTLPHLDGVSAIAHLKQDPETQRIRTIAVGEPRALRGVAATLPADGVLCKPFDPDTLVALVMVESRHLGAVPWSRFFQ